MSVFSCRFKKGFIPRVRVENLNDYFSLPKKDREYFGFYKYPVGYGRDVLTLLFSNKKLKKWQEGIKEEYPVQWFFREWLFSPENPVFKALLKIKYRLNPKKIWYKAGNFFRPAHPRFRKAYPRTEFRDLSEAMIDVNFAMILDFWFEEVWQGNKNNLGESEQMKAFLNDLSGCVIYILIGRKILQERHGEILQEALEEGSVGYNKRYDLADQIEKEIESKDSHYLKWFVENRGFFWT